MPPPGTHARKHAHTEGRTTGKHNASGTIYSTP